MSSKGNQYMRDRSGSRSKSNNTPLREDHKSPQLKKVGNFLIDMDKQLGKGQYGVVYLSQEIPE